MKKILLLLFIFCAGQLKSQNLISNPGFEINSALPANFGEYYLATGWDNCSGGGTPDYFHTMGSVGIYFGTNLPHTGDAMAGFCPYHGSLSSFREYLTTQLSSPLVAGQTYTVSFWLASGINGGYGWGCNNIGVHFSTGPLVQTSSSPILLNPSLEIVNIFYDTVWTQFSFQYTATAADDYFTIGNFRDDASTQSAQFGVAYNGVYYFVDDISVEASNQTPVALFNAANHICPGTCTDFTNLSQNATSYLWTFPGATPGISTDVNPSNICYNTPGTFDVSLIASNSFSSDTLMLNNYITVYPYPPPQGISQSGDTLFAIQGAVSYQWFYNGSLISGATNYFYVAPQGGDYNLVATDANGCEVEAAIFDVVAGMASSAETELINVFPNPADKSITISLLGFNGDVRLTIFNSIGEKIAERFMNIGSSVSKLEIDVQKFSPGIYWIEIDEGDGLIRKIFVKK